MFYIKFAFRKITSNLKSHIVFYIITSLILFVMMCCFGINRNTVASEENQLDKHAMVALVHNAYYDGSGNRILMNDDLAKSFYLPEYVTDYYLVINEMLSSELKPLTYKNITTNTPKLVFNMLAYSDTSKAPPFVNGERQLIDGRYAANMSECNISEDLADLNGLNVGDSLKASAGRNLLTFKIVSIFLDTTVVNGSDLSLLKSKEGPQIDIMGKMCDTSSSADNMALRRNNIITAASSLNDVPGSRISGVKLFDEYDTIAFYIKDAESIPLFIAAAEASMSESMKEQFTLVDSSESINAMRGVLEKTQQSVSKFFSLSGLICLGICLLIIIFIINSSVYDIGVLRLRGLSKLYTAALSISGILITSLLSYLSACVMYFLSFSQISNKLYHSSSIDMFKNLFQGMVPSWNVAVALNDTPYLCTSLSPIELLVGFAAFALFIIFVTFVASLFIVRHEPMKTMVKY